MMISSIIIITPSCKKDNEQIADDTTISSDDALAESIFENVTNIADEAYENGEGGLKSGNENNLVLSGCAIVTLDLTVMPHELIVDFGEANCLCMDGRYRKGKIIVTFTGGYRVAGTVISYGFENYYVNDHHVEGTLVLTNMGLNANDNMYYTIEVVGLIHKANNGGTISWNSSRVREWIEGRLTWYPSDDIYLITGTADGITAYGQTWEREITNPLRVELNCQWIVSGSMEIQSEGVPLILLDFGYGECDNIATALIDGVTYTIFMP